MIEAFYSGRAGLTAHQNSLDVVANNIANVSTTGYKSKTQSFGSLLSVSEVRPETANSANLIAGSGSAISSVQTDMSDGTFTQTNKTTDYYVNNNSGFFAVKDKAGKIYYTKDGSFQKMATKNGYVLATADGMTVLDASGKAVKFNAAGTATGNPGVYTFTNAPGLLSAGENLYVSTNVSGNAKASTTKPIQGVLEGSNVDLSTQMVGMITSQRGYQFSSTVVSTANQIETMVNELAQK